MPSSDLRAAAEKRLLQLWFDTPRTLTARIAQLLARAALSPMATLVAAVAKRRRLRIDRRSDRSRPAVVVIGNLVVGGAGKTPVVAALAAELRARGFTPGVLARGYRASSATARLVGPQDRAIDAGDEPLLLARATHAPVAVGADRAAALALLTEHFPQVDVAISDDGLQHVGLPRDVEVAVFDSRGAGNARVLPAGPLREPLAALRQVDALLLNGTRDAPAEHPHVFETRTVPVGFRPVTHAEATVEPVADFVARIGGARVAALAGIGSPQRFFALLRACGLDCAQTIVLPDHVAPDPAMLADLDADVVLMTEKDAVKCEGFADARCWALLVRAELESAFVDFVERRLHNR